MSVAMYVIRELIADHIERLIMFLDATELDADLESEAREDDPAESGIGDMDGMLEQLSGRYNCGGHGAAGFASHAEQFRQSSRPSNRILWRDIED
jgi:hypothetical protein